MKRTVLFALCCLNAAVHAEGFDYSKVNGNDAATYNALNEETTRLNRYTFGNSLAIQNLSGRADDTDLALIGQSQRNDQQDIRLNGHDAQFANQDAVNDALSTKLNGMYTDTAGLRSEVRNARREAKEAKAGAAAALAVAAQQMCTRVECGGQLALSGSTLGGYQAVALGVGAPLSDRWFVNAAYTQAGSMRGGAVSATYSLGK